MAAPERRLSAEAKPFAPPTGPTLAKVVSRDDDEPPRRRGVIVDNLKVSYGFVRLDDDAAAQDLFLHLTDCAYDEPRAGDRVSLVVATYNNKPKAVDVQLNEICALCVVALRDRFGGDDGAFHCPSCREPILPCFPINKNRGLMAALRLNERLARRRR